MHGGGAVRRQWKRSMVGMAVVVGALAACSDDQGATERATVADGDSWSSLATRVAGCEAPVAVDAAGRYLRQTNAADASAPIVGDDVRYDPEVLRAIACDTDPSTADPTAADPDAAAAAATTAPPEQGAELTASSAPPTAEFIETFDDPASIQRFDWQLHHGASFGQTLFSWAGDHDESCGGPTTTRDIEVVDRVVLFPDGVGDPADYGNFVYWCAPKGVGSGHLMTSFATEGYAQVGFSPQATFTGLWRICWDQNQTDLGSRKWTQVVVVPEDTFVANDRRLDYVTPVLADGPGAGGLVPDDDVFLFELNRGSTVVNVGTELRSEDFAGFVTTDKARRYTTCITDREDGSVLLELERETVTESRVLAGSLPDGPARVIFQDDSYNPPKEPSPVDDGFTWHWDDIVIETA